MVRRPNSDNRDPDLVARARAAYQRTLGPPDQAEALDPEILARLERGLASLPELTRKIFLAHRIDGLGYAEIARITDLSDGEVQRHIATSIDRLARYAEGDERPGWWRKVGSLLRRWGR